MVAEPVTMGAPPGAAPGSAPKPPLPGARREWRITKLARLGVYCAVVSLGIGLVAARSVYGDVKSSAMSIGHELGKMGDVGTGRPLRINGEPIFIGSSTEDVPVAAILERAEAGCRSGFAGVSADIDGLSATLRQQVGAGVAGTRTDGILHEDHGDRGMVACLVRGDGRLAGTKEMVAQLSALMSTGDLGQVGMLRYVFAEKTASGRTHVVVASTSGPFNLYALLPEPGRDAPGSDVAGAPRPPGAQRILSADIEGVPYGVRLYDTAATPTEVVRLYDTEMPARGWEPSGGAAASGQDQRAYSRPGSDLLVITSKDGERTVVSLIEMRGR